MRDEKPLDKARTDSLRDISNRATCVHGDDLVPVFIDQWEGLACNWGVADTSYLFYMASLLMSTSFTRGSFTVYWEIQLAPGTMSQFVSCWLRKRTMKVLFSIVCKQLMLWPLTNNNTQAVNQNNTCLYQLLLMTLIQMSKPYSTILWQLSHT